MLARGNTDNYTGKPTINAKAISGSARNGVALEGVKPDGKRGDQRSGSPLCLFDSREILALPGLPAHFLARDPSGTDVGGAQKIWPLVAWKLIELYVKKIILIISPVAQSVEQLAVKAKLQLSVVRRNEKSGEFREA